MNLADLKTNALATGVQLATSTVRNAASIAATQSPTITSTDFMKLLVTEMKNQDPTQPTDPNAYIQQLVGVNSLQQLISINGELGSSVGGKTNAISGQ